MDAQRQAVADFVAGRESIIAEFTEVESTCHRRPEVQTPLALCQKKKACLLIRLARNVAFISNLMESRVDFVAADMPEANRLTIHILAAVAEYERELISTRTKAALEVTKQRGTRLDNPNPIPASKQATVVLKTQTIEYHATVRPLILELQRQGYTLSATAKELNKHHVPTARGGLWPAATVKNILVS